MNAPQTERSAGAAQVQESSEFASLLQKEFRPKTDQAREAVEAAVQTLAQQALAASGTISGDAYKTVQAIIAEIDKRLSEQVNLIIHHAEFQQLEGAWRGLHHLVTNTETDEMLKIRVMNISKKELHRTLRRYKGVAWDQSPVFKKVYEEEYGQFGGEPFGCLVGDYHFDHSPPDVELLGEMAKVAASAHCPFISGASPALMQMESWQELANPRDLTKIFTNTEYAAWRSLRDSEDSKYIGLAMPRYLSRLPYGAKTNPVDEFDFEEETSGGDHGKYCWANAAYAMAVNINRSFKYYGWCTSIRGVESGGAVENLPAHTFPSDDGGVDMKCPTEIAISDRREAELAKNGFMPLVHRKNSDVAAFIGAQSLNKPAEYYDADASANANLSARLPYMFACSRFAHYLKCIVRDKIGSFRERADMERWLNDWIMNYVDGDPANSSQETKARKPLAAAEVKVEEIEGNPGYYSSKMFLRPHYQLEGLTVSLRLVSKLPSHAAPPRRRGPGRRARRPAATPAVAAGRSPFPFPSLQAERTPHGPLRPLAPARRAACRAEDRDPRRAQPGLAARLPVPAAGGDGPVAEVAGRAADGRPARRQGAADGARLPRGHPLRGAARRGLRRPPLAQHPGRAAGLDGPAGRGAAPAGQRRRRGGRHAARPGLRAGAGKPRPAERRALRMDRRRRLAPGPGVRAAGQRQLLLAAVFRDQPHRLRGAAGPARLRLGRLRGHAERRRHAGRLHPHPLRRQRGRRRRAAPGAPQRVDRPWRRPRQRPGPAHVAGRRRRARAARRAAAAVRR
jgi:type VI secretion system protein ImpC